MSTSSAVNERYDPVPFFYVLGVRVNAVQIPDVVELMERWIGQQDASRYVAVTGMHGVTESRHDAQFWRVLDEADLVVPDGMPLVWMGRWHGFRLARRVYGPELMLTFCRTTGQRYRHFFYGGAPGVAERVAHLMQQRYRITVAGTYSPPFRLLTAEEDREVADLIRSARPDVLWVGLSTPKQEHWMHQHRGHSLASIMLGVGAAFDLNAGTLRQAPRWMREHGLEWLFRLLAEPRRLWRRYLVYGSEFVWNIFLETAGINNSNGHASRKCS